eukprot:scaffold123493_cov25-Tisochrysis_lutea.AAC.3
MPRHYDGTLGGAFDGAHAPISQRIRGRSAASQGGGDATSKAPVAMRYIQHHHSAPPLLGPPPPLGEGRDKPAHRQLPRRLPPLQPANARPRRTAQTALQVQRLR